MCGIAGILSSDISEEKRTQIVSGMNDGLSHRGPDGSGIYSDELVTLGHRRLAIIDLATGDQPMRFGPYRIVFNGEIYNYREIAERLKSTGHQFLTTSDTEVILHAFAEWGIGCVDHLSGIFAFAIWDDSNKCLHLVRDRAGIKPLFYSRINNDVVFCSEITPMIESTLVPAQANSSALHHFFMFGYCFNPETAFQFIQEIPPACWARFDHNTAPITQSYWSPAEVAPFRGSFRDACSQLDDLLNDVVNEQLVSDVPVSTFLSGGIDSSSITALAQKHYSGNIEAFTVGFPEAAYDESRWAKMVAEHCRTKHTVVDLRQEPIVVEDIEGIVKHTGQPFADSSCIPTYFVCKEAGRSYKVVLSGDGADELFYGYTNFEFYSRIMSSRRVPRFFRKLMAGMVSMLPDMSFAEDGIRQVEKALRYSFLSDDEAIAYLNSIVDPYQLRQLFKKELYDNQAHDPIQRMSIRDEEDALGKMITYLFNQSLPQDMLTKVDRMSMRSSIEVRVPFLDHRIVEFAYSLPKEFTIRNGVRKFILREVMAKYLPQEVFTHQKHGFDIPLDYYYKKEFLADCRDLLLSSSSYASRIMDRDKMQAIIEANCDLKSASRRKYSRYTWLHLFWMLMQFEVWARRFKVTL